MSWASVAGAISSKLLQVYRYETRSAPMAGRDTGVKLVGGMLVIAFLLIASFIALFWILFGRKKTPDDEADDTDNVTELPRTSNGITADGLTAKPPGYSGPPATETPPKEEPPVGGGGQSGGAGAGGAV